MSLQNLHICNVLLRSTSVGVRTVIHTSLFVTLCSSDLYYVIQRKLWSLLQDWLQPGVILYSAPIQGVIWTIWNVKVLKLPINRELEVPVCTGLFFMEDLLSCPTELLPPLRSPQVAIYTEFATLNSASHCNSILLDSWGKIFLGLSFLSSLKIVLRHCK